MRRWIRFAEPRGKRYHALLAEGAERMVTMCGRSFERERIRDTSTRPQHRCAACAARLAGRAAYLVPQRPEVDRLLDSRQLRLLETRQDVLAREARAGRKNRERMTRAAEQRREQRG
jgi:hypothetical protein